MSEMKNIDNNNLENVTGGNGYPQGELHVAEPNVKAGTYLALRSQPSWNDSNEIAQIYPGNRFYVDVKRTADGSGYTYFWANYNGTWGWVNTNYLTLLD
ncbi:MAG: SH3 domain-containing protein [Blautia sp.]|nr:SH3 domain-containing protein [Blautia sp.]